jgi:predicted metallo-beta-lactamase superfamily hydrolase
MHVFSLWHWCLNFLVSKSGSLGYVFAEAAAQYLVVDHHVFEDGQLGQNMQCMFTIKRKRRVKIYQSRTQTDKGILKVRQFQIF